RYHAKAVVVCANGIQGCVVHSWPEGPLSFKPQQNERQQAYNAADDYAVEITGVPAPAAPAGIATSRRPSIPLLRIGRIRARQNTNEFRHGGLVEKSSATAANTKGSLSFSGTVAPAPTSVIAPPAL